MKRMELPDDVKWIGVEGKNDFSIETTYFKNIFSCSDITGEAILYISANTRYCLYINGTELLHGPCKADHWHHFCDTVNIAPYLVQGKNVIAVKVTAYPPYETTKEDYGNFGPIWAMSPHTGPMLIVWGELDNGTDISTSRSAWYYRNDSTIQWHLPQQVIWMGCTEEVSGAKLPWGWQTDTVMAGDFIPARVKWNNTVRFGEVPSLFLYERPIKYLLRNEIAGLSVLTHSEGFTFPIGNNSVVLSANSRFEAIIAAERLTTSFVYLKCKNGAGSVIKLLYAEAFSKNDGQRPKMV